MSVTVDWLKVWTDADSTKRTLPIPAKFEYQFADVDKDSGRTDDGKMVRNRVAQKVKLILSWNPLKTEIHQQMMRLLKGLPPFFYCEYPDPDGSVRKIECYHGDIKATMYHFDSITNNLYKETSCDFIER